MREIKFGGKMSEDRETEEVKKLLKELIEEKRKLLKMIEKYEKMKKERR
ncbi:MAG: hypothetical protein MRT15_09400 [archaeon YNP-LCB-003-016]|nr:hypothetical protein [Candidatus Culexarchaeum yellowstonense]